MQHVQGSVSAPFLGAPTAQVDLYYGSPATEALKALPAASVDCICTSPPYWQLRDYPGEDVTWGDGWQGQLGRESTPDEYVAHLVEVFEGCRRVLKDTGTLWINIGDSYMSHPATDTTNIGGFHGERMRKGEEAKFDRAYKASMGKTLSGDLKDKDIAGIPWLLAFALRKAGWYLRQDIIWAKGVSGVANEYGYHGNPMPDSAKDRCSKAHEYVFLLSKSKDYYYDSDAVSEKTANGEGRRNRRSVWTVNVKAYKGSHTAVYPTELVRPMILAGCPVGGTVLDPFSGSGTTGEVAVSLGRNFIGLDLDAGQLETAKKRCGL